MCRGHLFQRGLQMSREQWYSLLRFFCISQMFFVLDYPSWGPRRLRPFQPGANSAEDRVSVKSDHTNRRHLFRFADFHEGEIKEKQRPK